MKKAAMKRRIPETRLLQNLCAPQSGAIRRGRSCCPTYALLNQILQLFKLGIWNQNAVWMRIPRDQKRDPLPRTSLEEKNRLLLRRSKQIAGLKAQAKRRA